MGSSLSKLSQPAVRSEIKPPRRRWLTRYGLPAALALMTLFLLASSAMESILPGLEVQVARVVLLHAPAGTGSSDSVAAGGVTVQAAGWVEPDPHPIYVSALADGIVEELLVLEGEQVNKGQVVARLIKDDALLALTMAEARLARATAELNAAETDWENPVALIRAAAVNEAALAEARAELRRLMAEAERDKALLDEATVVFESLLPLSREVVAQVEVDKARHQRQSRRAAMAATGEQIELVRAKVRRFEAELRAAEKDLELKVDVKRDLEEARAAVLEAKAQVEEAKLRLERMDVTAPAAGTVMNRLVAPGSKIRQAMDGAFSAHVVHLYNPDRLQVRVDVPLADAANVGVGQSAEVIVDVLPEKVFPGRVTRFVHQADISKNTVQVKVAIESPSRHVKPDMLARVKFLGRASVEPGSEKSQNDVLLHTFVPENALIEEAGEVYAWVVETGSSKVSRRRVRRGPGSRDNWQQVVEGLNVGERVVYSPPRKIREGRRVTMSREVLP